MDGPRVRAAVALAFAATLLSGCASSVDASPAAGAASAGCAAVGSAWPDRVGGQDRRETTTDSPAVAAWGDPAIVARCGVTPPTATSAECIDADGVDWIVHPLEDGTSFTTFGREPAVEVLVPKDYAPEPLVLGSLGSAMRTIPQGDHRCT